MPIIDVTDILFDTDIAGQVFTVIRRPEIVNDFGESTIPLPETIAGVIGSIQPADDNALMREGSYDAQAKSVVIVTTFRLRGATKGPAGKNYKPDIILFGPPEQQDMYEVNNVKDWTPFGAGFIEATATTIPWIDFSAPPMIPDLYIGRLDFMQPRNSSLVHGAGGMF
jgi:hypothetical protein